MANDQQKIQEETEEGVMSLTDHLKELRNRVIVCILFLLIGFLLCFYNGQDLVDILTDMAIKCGYSFVTLTPQELLLQYMRLGLVGAVVLASPVLGYEIYAFMKPGLKTNENSFFFFALIAGLICFIIGVAFAHFISMPFMLQFLIGLNDTNYITSSISVENYLSFVLTVYLIFGIVFEMPVLSVALTQFGLLKPNWLMAGRKVAIVLCFFIAAVITPPDIVSQIMVAIPMIFLYQISIYLSKIVFKNKVKNNPYASDKDLEIAGIKKKQKNK